MRWNLEKNTAVWVSGLLLYCKLLNVLILFILIVLLSLSLSPPHPLALVHKYLLTFYHMPSIVIGLGDGTINQTPSPTGVDILVGETDHKLGDTYIF